MPRLARERSAYLRRHAHDPVGWRPWGDEAFALARAADRPVLLSIGFFGCPWCRRMHAEAYADPAAVARIRDGFVPVLVDRDARPDVDALYVQALLAIRGEAGWPATLFLLPDGRPFTGATWLPRDAEHGLPAFVEVLDGVTALWRSARDELEAAGDSLRRAWLAPPAPTGQRDAVSGLVGLHDARLGGFGDGARFPQAPENTALLIAAAGGHEPARRAVRRNLDEMARGGLHDALGGGFFRTCADPAWRRPRFEKTLYDNAQLLRLYARASRVFSGGGRLAAEAARRDVEVARGVARYLWTDLAHPDGGFCAGEAADDPVGEGAFYRWTADDAEVPLDGALARPVRERLAEARARRPRPFRDEARIVAWNGLAASALAEAGRLLGFSDWVDLAASTLDLLLAARRPDGLLPRRVGADALGFLDDQAAVAEALLAMAQARPGEPRWRSEAVALARATLDRFGAGGARSVADDLPVHRPAFTDEAVPSPPGVLAEVLRQLVACGALDRAPLDALLAAAAPTMRALPAATSTLHAVAAALADPPPRLTIEGDPDDPVVVRMLRAWDRTWRPGGLAVVVPGGPPRARLDGSPIDAEEALEAALAAGVSR